VKLSPGKQKGLNALSTQRGIIAALAIDQRSALRKLFAKATGRPPEEVRAEWLVEFKEHVSRILTPYASAILLDPEFGLPAAALRYKDAGLLLAYERTGYDKSIPGRLPSLLDGFSVARLKQAGADAVKVLLYYSPYSSGDINKQKHDWVERIGTDCLAADVPFFLELISYHDAMDETSVDFARIKPETVIRSIEEFCKARYSVDVLKVGVPVSMRFVESPNLPGKETIYSHAEALAHFRRASDASSLPFIYLSEGVSNEMFSHALSLAAEAGSTFSGVLCGRATWQDGVPIFVRGGASALEEWLQARGTRNVQAVNELLAAAHPWMEKLSAAGAGKV
jgi:tagatose 1,6-diphosphate aldolase